MAHLVLAYKNFAVNRNVSHIGLGVAALNTAKCLQAIGHTVDVWPIVSAQDLKARLSQSVTHCVVSAPWIPTADWYQLLTAWPRIKFAVNCHSNVGFLQADTRGVALLQEYSDLEQATLNFRLSANSRKGAHWFTAMYTAPCLYLPNLYYLNGVEPVQATWRGGLLRIGAFGAQRPLKNLMSAAGAAGQIAADLRADVELWLSGGRAEGGGQGVVEAVKTLRNPHLTIRQTAWQTWPQFRDTVRSMHLLLNVSYTESFNMVTADGIAEGVPSVVSEAIDWAPHHWRAGADEVGEIARVGRTLLCDQFAQRDGLRALRHHNECGVRAWADWLG